MKAELDDRLLRSLSPPETGRIELSDTKRRGLRIRVSTKGRFVWMYEKRIKGGKKRKHTLSSWPSMSLSEARRIALELEAEAAKGIDRVADRGSAPLFEEQNPVSDWTVRRVIETYGDLHLVTLRTGAERKRQIVQSLTRVLDVPISKLQTKDLQAAIDAKVLDGHLVYANRIRSALMAFTHWAWLRGHLDQDMGLRLAKATKELPRERAPALSEIRAIYNASGELGALWGPLVKLLILTGQRRSEITKLRWEELDLKNCQMLKAGPHTKNSKPHITHLSKPAIALISGLGERDKGFLFTTTGTSPVSGISRMKKRLDKLLGNSVEPWRFHDIRSGMATELVEHGVPETVVDRIQNHVAGGSAPSAVSRIYNRAELLSERAKTLDLWASLVTGQSDDTG